MSYVSVESVGLKSMANRPTGTWKNVDRFRLRKRGKRRGEIEYGYVENVDRISFINEEKRRKLGQPNRYGSHINEEKYSLLKRRKT